MKGICSVCKERKLVHRNRKTGKRICHNCYQMASYRDPSMHEKCSKCEEVKPVAMRTKAGKPICPACYQQNRVGRCTNCGQDKVIQACGLCYACYQNQRRASIRLANMAAHPA